jgi:hypothetical protein
MAPSLANPKGCGNHAAQCARVSPPAAGPKKTPPNPGGVDGKSAADRVYFDGEVTPGTVICGVELGEVADGVLDGTEEDPSAEAGRF